MLTTIDEGDGERVLTVRIDEPTIEIGLIRDLEPVLDEVEHAAIENVVFRFGGTDRAGDFPAWEPGPARQDMRYFARWDETLSRISGLTAKTFAAYDGHAGAAAVQVGLVADLRLASARARLSTGSLSEGHFPGAGAYWLPKFVGLGTARRILLLGEDLPVERAVQLGLLDVVDDSVDVAVHATIKALRPVPPETACLTRRILNDSYLLERGAAAELTKAARYQVGMATRSSQWPET
jgi:enoyl-CoA hydratase/carnithine racemase